MLYTSFVVSRVCGFAIADRPLCVQFPQEKDFLGPKLGDKVQRALPKERYLQLQRVDVHVQVVR